jgi:hypothetical protein
MHQYMTVVLLICATILGQGQPAQLPARLFAHRAQQELALQAASQPYRRAQLKLLAQVNLCSILQLAAQSYQQPHVAPQPAIRTLPLPLVFAGIVPKFMPASVLLLRGP